MTESFNLPDLGEGIHEAEVLAVHVKQGQDVTEGDIILEMETDKAAVEIPSPFTGKALNIHVKTGDIVKVGDALIEFDRTGEAATKEDTAQSAPESESDSTTRPAKNAIIPASPATRQLARELGVELHKVTPTGSGGVVTAEDVKGYSTQKGDAQKELSPQEVSSQKNSRGPVKKSTGDAAGEALPDFSRWGEIEREPLRSIRRATATQMAKAWSQIPHVTSQDTVDITKLEEFRKKHKKEIEEEGGRLTLTVFALKAIASALKKYPHFNASLDLSTQEIIVKKYYNIGVAVDTDRGLIVPVIKDVDRKSIKEIAVELYGCIEKTRSGKISHDDLQGGTITVTNAGALGGGSFSAIINHPEVAIFGMGQGRLQPMVVPSGEGDYSIKPRLMMPIVLCFDHRVVDGADAIRFLRVIIDSLEDPDELLMTMI